MNKEYITDALSEIDDDYIIEANSIFHADNETKESSPDNMQSPKAKTYYKQLRFGLIFTVVALLAILLLNHNIIISSFFTVKTNEPETKKDDNVQKESSSIPTDSNEKGLYIPRSKINLVKRDDVCYSWAAPLVVYNSRSYSGLGFSEEVDNSLLEEHLGTCTGLLEPGSDPSEYVDFSGNIEGELYAVKGYDTDFLIGLKSSYSDSSDTFTLLMNDNDITLTTGADIFEKRLHLAGNYTKVTYQSRKDWYHSKGNIKTFDNASSDIITNFVTALNQGEVMHIDSIPLEDKDSSIYDEKELCHLLFYKKDGIVIELCCLKGGYVIFDGMHQVCVKISKESFNQVCYAFDK